MPIDTGVLTPIVQIIVDYRAGEIPKPDTAHVKRWVEQFPQPVREPMLIELGHVLHKTYIPRQGVETFLTALIDNPKIAGGDPSAFWKGAHLLNIQRGGNSQRDMLRVIDGVLKTKMGFGISACGQPPKRFLYIDDGLFTGNRVLNDLRGWVQEIAPPKAELHAVFIAMHAGGQHYADRELAKLSQQSGKDIKIKWWRAVVLEDRKTYINSSDVLRPTSLPCDADVQAYANSLQYKVELRTLGSVGALKIFSSEQGRDLLEQELLKAGVAIRKMCPNLKKFQRPLGNMVLETLGFGSTIVTYRNCPNNAPLAFWAGDPWYPLFTRKTN